MTSGTVYRAGAADDIDFTRIETPVWSAYLTSQRWFGANDRRVSAVSVVGAPIFTVAGRRWVLAVVRAVFDRGPPQDYFLPFGVTAATAPRATAIALPGGGHAHDCACDPSYVAAVLAAVRDGLVLPFHAGTIRFVRTTVFDEHLMPERLVCAPISAEQSNTSALIESYAVLKTYRRLQAGLSPEIEVARFLTERGYTGTPPLLGSIELTRAEGNRDEVGLAVLFRWVANGGDGWTRVLQHLNDILSGRGRVATRANDSYTTAFLSLLERLGQRTAELHRALCPDGGVAATFAPEPVTPDDLSTWRGRVRADAEAMFDTLTTHRWSGANADAAARVLARRDALHARINRLVSTPLQAMKTRYHGDYHLGQVLVTKDDDFQIVDFEGEPRRSIAERRAKHTPIKDLAGMLRSFDYAAAAALKELGPDSARRGSAAGAHQWRKYSAASFLRGYRRTIEGCPSYPTDARAAAELLHLLILEKAIYEVGYELANRPDWVGIPLTGILDLIDAPTIPPIAGFGSPG